MFPTKTVTVGPEASLAILGPLEMTPGVCCMLVGGIRFGGLWPIGGIGGPPIGGGYPIMWLPIPYKNNNRKTNLGFWDHESDMQVITIGGIPPCIMGPVIK